MNSILFINSDPKAQRIFVHALGDLLPKTVCFVTNDEHEALEIIRDIPLVPDTILLDLSCLGEKTIFFFHSLKQEFSVNMPLIVAHVEDPTPAMVVTLNRLGVFAISCKPYSYTVIREIVESHISTPTNEENQY